MDIQVEEANSKTKLIHDSSLIVSSLRGLNSDQRTDWGDRPGGGESVRRGSDDVINFESVNLLNKQHVLKIFGTTIVIHVSFLHNSKLARCTFVCVCFHVLPMFFLC